MTWRLLPRGGGSGGGEPGGSTDPYWGDVIALLHFDNNITDQKGNVWTIVGSGCGPDAAQSKWGGYSLLVPASSGHISTPSAAGFQLGGGDFTLECWARTAIPGHKTFIAKWTAAGYDWMLGLNSGGELAFFSAPAYPSRPLASTALGWHHYAVCRQGNNMRFYQDGVQLGTTFPSLTNWTDSNAVVTIGAASNTNFLDGHIDDVRVTKGVARYTGAVYEVPAAAFPDAGSRRLSLAALDARIAALERAR